MKQVFLGVGILFVVCFTAFQSFVIEDSTSTPLSPASQQAAAIVSFPTSPDAPTQKETQLSTKATNVGDVAEIKEDSSQKNENEVVRVLNPYPQKPLSFEEVNENTRKAVINIICKTPQSNFDPLSGSGVVIDPRGVILTNAHIGQYVLLQDASPVDIQCAVRGGSPAKHIGTPHVLYISSEWVKKHAPDIRLASPTGTGEHDFALLVIESNGTTTYPYLTPETREGVTFKNDRALVASYPAGFTGGITLQTNLQLTSTITSIRELYTFARATIDLFSLGGIIVAQGGSSGGAVVNQWNRLVAIVATSSEGNTTAERDLRGITLSYIERALRSETGAGLQTLLTGDLVKKAGTYQTDEGAVLAQSLMDAITQR